MIRHKKRFQFFLILTCIWLGVIFSFSMEKREDSDRTSMGVGRWVAKILLPGFHDMTEEEQTTQVQAWNGVLRKGAHFTEYLILGSLLILTLMQTRIWDSKTRAFLLAGGGGMLYAISDEIHQYFVPGRACQIMDVCIDTMGVLTGIAVMMLINRRKETKSQQ